MLKVRVREDLEESVNREKEKLVHPLKVISQWEFSLTLKVQHKTQHSLAYSPKEAIKHTL